MSSSLRIARLLTYAVIALAAVASTLGLILPGLYRDTAWVVPQNRGQDLITLIAALPTLAVALHLAHNGSMRATVSWFGLLGYIWYTYTGAAFSYRFNELFLVYVALFSLSTFALASMITGLDTTSIVRTFSTGRPRRATAIYLFALALMLSMLWLGQIVPFFTTGAVPELMRLADTPTVFVYVLDLGIVVPLSVVAGIALWNEQAWGYILTGFILAKASAMGLALLSMTWFAMQAGQPTDTGLAVVWIVLAASALVTWLLFLRRPTTA